MVARPQCILVQAINNLGFVAKNTVYFVNTQNNYNNFAGIGIVRNVAGCLM